MQGNCYQAILWTEIENYWKGWQNYEQNMCKSSVLFLWNEKDHFTQKIEVVRVYQV